MASGVMEDCLLPGRVRLIVRATIRRMLPVLTLLGLSPVAVHAQTGIDLSPSRLFPQTSGFLEPGDFLLGSIVLGSFALIGPFEDVDARLSGELASLGRDGYPLADFGDFMGTRTATLGISGGMALTGWAIGNDRIRRAGMHTFEAVMIGGLASHFLKIAVGRSRPGVSGDPVDIEPFSRLSGHGLSFPSGHATAAFAFATVMSSEFSDQAGWVPYVLYPMATWTAATRVMDEKHWVTDVVAGAAMGILAGRLVERFHNGPDHDWSTKRMTWSPMFGGTGVGLRGLVRFR